MARSFESIVAAAFRRGPAFQANALIEAARETIRAEHGWVVQVEVLLDGRSWEYLEREAAPRLALYLRSKKLGVAKCGPALVSVFLGETLHFLRGRDFFEAIRRELGQSEAEFAALAQAWEQTGRPPAPLATRPAPPRAPETMMDHGRELERAAGQLLVVGFDGVEPPPALLARIAAGEVGGVILFARNLREPRQVAALTRALAAAAPEGAPLLLGIDQEGGRVQRLRAPLAVWPPMRTLAAHRDPELTRAVGQALGCDLALLGFNLDFAPVLDVVTSDHNSVIGDRSFGANPEEVTSHALALARGLREGGVLACGKHFPGHGGPVADSHHTLPVDERSEGEWRAVDLPPFLAAIDAGLPLLMSAHVVYRALDPERPATLSHRICTGLLREELGFDGVLVSDDLEMGAIANTLGPAEAALGALRAGVDLLLFCHLEERQREAQQALARAARESPEDRARLEQAARRVRVLKRRLPRPAPVELDRVEELVSAAAHAALLARIAGA